MESDFLARLKQETSAHHQRLEEQLDLLREDFGLDSYLVLISRLYGFYLPWEGTVTASLCETAPDLLLNRRKADLLASDMRHLGLKPGEAPLCTSLPSLTTVADALGSVYVIEGSTLGGQLLTRHFASKLGLTLSSLSFFYGYGENTGRMWKQFRVEMLRLATSSTEDSIIASAQNTFESLAAWLKFENAVRYSVAVSSTP